MPLIAVDATQPWPLCIPGPQEALDVLSDSAPISPELQPVAARVRGTLGSLAQRSVSGQQLDFESGALAELAGMRLRLDVAAEVRRSWTGDMDGEAFEGLLAQVDVMLKHASAPDDAEAGIREAFDSERQALIGAAVNLMQAFKDGEQAAEAPAPAVAVAPPPPRARVVSNVAASPARPRRARTILAVLALSMALAGLTFSRMGTQGSLPALVSPAPGLVETGGGSAGVVLVHSADGKPITPEFRKELEAQAALSGRVVQEAGPGAVVLIPAPRSK